MKVWIKNLRGDQTELDVELTETVLSMKEKIHKLQGHEPSLQKLVCHGKIMDDTKQIGEYGVQEGDRLVIMISKPKPQPKAPAPAAQPSQPVSVPLPAQLSQPGQQPSSQEPSAGFFSEHASALVMGDQYEQTISQICDMGFPREAVVAAMRAAYNNPDRAIDYLMTGMPEAPAEEPAGQAEAEGESPLAFLLQNPMFLQIRQMIQQNPAILPGLLQQIQQTNPQLAQVIMQNQDEFLRLISEPLPGEAPAVDPSLIQGLPRPPAQPGAAQPPRGQIVLNPNEVEEIKRLQELGFSQRDALEAYLTCDRNEVMAANLLFESYVPLAMQEQFDVNQAVQEPPEGSSLAPGGPVEGLPPAEPHHPQEPHGSNPPPSHHEEKEEEKKDEPSEE